MKSVIVIPARIGSTRFPKKPLAEIAGKTMIRRVWEIARAVEGVDKVLVATDGAEIVEHVQSFGGEAVMTPETCKNGSERVWEAVQKCNEKFDVIVNLQGDAPLTPPWIISPLLAAMRADENVQIATPAVRMSKDVYEKMLAAKRAGEVGGTTVTFDKNHDALYFSKGIIPFVRVETEPLPVFKHIGVYAYRYATLEKYLSLPESLLEKTEGLEQLRALENGIPVRVVEVDQRGRTAWGVDSPADARRVEEIIAREGELFS